MLNPIKNIYIGINVNCLIWALAEALDLHSNIHHFVTSSNNSKQYTINVSRTTHLFDNSSRSTKYMTCYGTRLSTTKLCILYSYNDWAMKDIIYSCSQPFDRFLRVTKIIICQSTKGSNWGSSLGNRNFVITDLTMSHDENWWVSCSNIEWWVWVLRKIYLRCNISEGAPSPTNAQQFITIPNGYN